MLLTIDVGNTETKLGCFDRSRTRCSYTWRITTAPRRTADEYGVFFTPALRDELDSRRAP